MLKNILFVLLSLACSINALDIIGVQDGERKRRPPKATTRMSVVNSPGENVQFVTVEFRTTLATQNAGVFPVNQIIDIDIADYIAGLVLLTVIPVAGPGIIGTPAVRFFFIEDDPVLPPPTPYFPCYNPSYVPNYRSDCNVPRRRCRVRAAADMEELQEFSYWDQEYDYFGYY